MLVEQNVTVIRRLFQEVGVKMLPGSEGFDFSCYSCSTTCLEHFGRFFADVSSAFRGCHLNIRRIVGKGNKVMVHYSVCGTQKSDFMGVPPTGQKMTVTGICVFRLSAGKIAEHWDAAHQLNAASRTQNEPQLAMSRL